MNEFFSFPETGTLMIEKVLFDAGYPILFTCINEVGTVFLCVCCQCNKDGKKWLLSETTFKIVLDLLKDNITIRDAFLASNKRRFTIIQSDGLFLKEDVPEDWNEETSTCLPDVGEYMEADDNEFDEEIFFYENKMILENCKTLMENTKISFDWKFDVPMEKVRIKSDGYAIDVKEDGIELKVPKMRVSKLKERNAYSNYSVKKYAS